MHAPAPLLRSDERTLLRAAGHTPASITAVLRHATLDTISLLRPGHDLTVTGTADHGWVSLPPHPARDLSEPASFELDCRIAQLPDTVFELYTDRLSQLVAADGHCTVMAADGLVVIHDGNVAVPLPTRTFPTISPLHQGPA